MRRHVAAALVLFLLAIAESSLLPFMFGPVFRPGLVLVVSAVWASLRGTEGFVWAAGGGILLDLLSGAPLGLTAAALMTGNTVAAIVDRIPIPSRLLRSTNWVAMVTFVSHSFMLVVLNFAGQPFDVTTGLTSIMLPLLLANPLLGIPVHYILERYASRMKRAETFG